MKNVRSALVVEPSLSGGTADANVSGCVNVFHSGERRERTDPHISYLAERLEELVHPTGLDIWWQVAGEENGAGALTRSRLKVGRVAVVDVDIENGCIRLWVHRRARDCVSGYARICLHRSVRIRVW